MEYVSGDGSGGRGYEDGSGWIWMPIAAPARWLAIKCGTTTELQAYMKVGAPGRVCFSKCGVPGTVNFFPRAICSGGSKMLPRSNFWLKMGPQRNADLASYLAIWSICANRVIIEDACLDRLSRNSVKKWREWRIGGDRGCSTCLETDRGAGDMRMGRGGYGSR